MLGLAWVPGVPLRTPVWERVTGQTHSDRCQGAVGRAAGPRGLLEEGKGVRSRRGTLGGWQCEGAEPAVPGGVVLVTEWRGRGPEGAPCGEPCGACRGGAWGAPCGRAVFVRRARRLEVWVFRALLVYQSGPKSLGSPP